MLARGAHGSWGVIIGFAMPTLAGIMMGYTMLLGKVFSKTTSYFGIVGNTFLIIYIILITFVPGTKGMALTFAAPGGILSMVWMILFTIILFQLADNKPIKKII